MSLAGAKGSSRHDDEIPGQRRARDVTTSAVAAIIAVGRGARWEHHARARLVWRCP